MRLTMPYYENPAMCTDHYVGRKSIPWAMLFGLFYFLAKKAWAAAAWIFLALIALRFLSVQGVPTVFLLMLWFLVILPTQWYLKKSYKMQGWKIVEDDESLTNSTKADIG